MRELHVVATSEDGRHVVLATRKGAGSGDYRVALDDRLAAAVRGDLPRPGEVEPTVVTPKEIQARLRAGESPEQLAASAGVPVARIDRYAGPVLAERERVITQARAGFVSRSRLGASSLPLGDAVDRHLAETSGVRLETVQWSARREDSGSWLVELTYVSQARRRTAAWRYDVARREVSPTDSASAQLAHVEPGRASRPVEPASGARSRPTARAAGRRAAPVRDVATAPATRKVAARPSPPVRAAAPAPRGAAPGRAAQTAADRAATATAARAATARLAAKERAAQAAASKAARAAAAAEQAAAVQARAAQARADKRAADEASKAAAQRAKAEAARAAKAEAARAAAQKKAKAEAARAAKAKAEAARAAAQKKANAEAARAAEAEAARAAEAEAARAAEAEAARVAAAPSGPPTLRVVGDDDAPAPARRGPKQPPAAARTAPARAAGQRASVPGWADVLLSTAPVVRPSDPEPDEG